jgi:hypothetical protein
VAVLTISVRSYGADKDVRIDLSNKVTSFMARMVLENQQYQTTFLAIIRKSTTSAV